MPEVQRTNGSKFGEANEAHNNAMSKTAGGSDKAKSRRRSFERDDSESQDSEVPMDTESVPTKASSSKAHRRDADTVEKHYSRTSSSRTKSRHEDNEKRNDRHSERRSERSSSRNFKLNGDAPPFQPTHYTCNQSTQVDDDTFCNDSCEAIDGGTALQQTIVSNDYQQSVQAPSFTAAMPQQNVVLNDQPIGTFINGMQPGVACQQQPYLTNSFCSVPPAVPINSQPQFSAPNWSGPRPYYSPAPSFGNHGYEGFVPYRRPFNPYYNRFNPFGNMRSAAFGRGGMRFRAYNYYSPDYGNPYTPYRQFDRPKPFPEYKARHPSIPIYATASKKTDEANEAAKHVSIASPKRSEKQSEADATTVSKTSKAGSNHDASVSLDAATREEDLASQGAEEAAPGEVVQEKSAAASNSKPADEDRFSKLEEKMQNSEQIAAGNGWVLKHDNGAPPTAGWRMQKEGPLTIGHRVVQSGKMRGMRLPTMKLKKTKIDLPFYSAHTSLNGSLAGSDVEEDEYNGMKASATKLNSGSRSASAFYSQTAVSEAYYNGLFRWLRAMRLHKYTDALSTLSPEELVTCSEEQLSALDLTPGAVKKFMVVRDFLKHPLQSGALQLGQFPCVENAPRRGIYSNLINWAIRYGFMSEDESDQDSDEEAPQHAMRAQSQENLRMPALTYENRSHSSRNLNEQNQPRSIDVVTRPRFTPRSSSPYSNYRQPFNPMYHTVYRTPFRGAYRGSFRGFGYHRSFYSGQYFNRPLRPMNRMNPYFVRRPYGMNNYMNPINMYQNGMNNANQNGNMMQGPFVNNMNMNPVVQYDPFMNNCVTQPQQNVQLYTMNPSNTATLPTYQAVPVAMQSFATPLNGGVTVMQNDQFLNNTVQYAVSTVNPGNVNYGYVN